MIPAQALRLALWPVSVAYGGVIQVRSVLYRLGVLRSKRLGGTVISVGNLTVGGTGKTPMVLWLAERLVAEGHRPAILTRGYRGGAQADARGLPLADEVALLRERLGGRAQLGVGKDRYSSGRTLERHGARWFILDDGFQHLALQRDADIVLLDATDPFGGGRLLPAGRLREPRAALARADVVVISRTEHAPAIEAIVRRFTRAPIFYAQVVLDAVLRAPALSVALPETDWRRGKFYGFCGIGNSPAFFEDLRRWGFLVVGKRSFRDHHRYSPTDLEELDRAAGAAGAEALICTEKDVFNLRDTVATRIPIYACRIRLALSDADGFCNAVFEAARQSRPVAHA
jgi:tetraacyldisaccharide 4'-kinase